MILAKVFPDLTQAEETHVCKSFSLRNLQIFEYLEDEDAVEYLSGVDTLTSANIINEWKLMMRGCIKMQMKKRMLLKRSNFSVIKMSREELTYLKHYGMEPQVQL